MSLQFPNPGDTFEGNFLIEAILGSGGFARVYRGVEIDLERKVALKILRPPLNSEQSDSERDDYLETLMKRFQREALLLGKLRSPYTVTMYHYGKTEDGLLYMVLEYIDGLSLAEILRDGRALPADRVRKILSQVLSSLHEAHLMGMLHRDLKPANIMVYDHLGQRDQVKLLDFGIAKLVTEASPENRKDLTSDGTLIGTPRYMAPEQIQNAEEVGPPSDIYALGLVAYEMLTGEQAIDGESSIQIIGRQLAPDSFRLPEDLVIPPRLRAIINRMMEKKLSARYATAAEIIEALEAPDVLDSEEIPELAFEPVPLEEVSEGSEVEVLDDDSLEEWAMGPASPEAEYEAKRRRVIVIGLAVGLALLALVTFAALSGEDSPPEPDVVAEESSEEAIEVVQAPEPELEPEPETDLEPEGEPMIIEPPTLVVSNLEGIEIAVDDEVLGVTPHVTIPAELLPARVVARFEGTEKEFDVDAGQDELRIDFEPIAKAEPPPSRPAPAPSRPTKPSKPSKPTPKPSTNPYAPVE